MLKSCSALILITTCLCTQAGATSISWTGTETPIEIAGYPVGEAEPDYVLRLTCLRGGTVQVGVGANNDIGSNRGMISVTLRSGDRSVTLSGKSAKSKNWEMTVSRELRTQLRPSDASKARLLGVLTNGLPIQVSGAMRDTWTVGGLAEKTRAFGESCSNN